MMIHLLPAEVRASLDSNRVFHSPAMDGGDMRGRVVYLCSRDEPSKSAHVAQVDVHQKGPQLPNHRIKRQPRFSPGSGPWNQISAPVFTGLGGFPWQAASFHWSLELQPRQNLSRLGAVRMAHRLAEAGHIAFRARSVSSWNLGKPLVRFTD